MIPSTGIKDNPNINIGSNIPEVVKDTILALYNAGYEAFIVGGCVRDLLLGLTPKDWDITTNALPSQIASLFPKTLVEEKFGTVTVIHENISDETTKFVQITPYRSETNYIDGRHPENIVFANTINEDLSRRDFTINALAYDLKTAQIIDLFDGMADIKAKVIRSVGNPDERFAEDGLRILRAIRFACQLGFMINQETQDSIQIRSKILEKISRERIRDEFLKIIMSKNPSQGLFMAHKLGILSYISKEIEQSVGVKQNQAHSYDVFEHLLRSLQCAADKEFMLHVRLSALFHDIGKPKTAIFSRENNDWTFYGHEVVGARLVTRILEDLKVSHETSDKVIKLVRWHMFFSDTETITLSAVRRIIVNVGKDLIWDLINLRICDRVGTGRPKENPYRLRKYKAMIEEALLDPIDLSMLKIDGNTLMKDFEIAPGPKIGYILQAIFNEVIENPHLNNKKDLSELVKKYNNLDIEVLKALSLVGKSKMDELNQEEIKKIRNKHFVE